MWLSWDWGPWGSCFARPFAIWARCIIGVDPVAERRSVALKMGAHAVLDPGEKPVEAVLEATDGKLADLVVEAVGHREQALNLCVHLCRKEGRLLSFGVPTRTIDGLHWSELFWKNIIVHTSVGPDFEQDFPLAMRWINEGRINVRPLITHRFPVEQIQAAFDLFHSRKDGVLKVLIDFPRS